MSQGARPQEHPAVAPRHPTTIDLLAGALLIATIVLHVIAMFPHYFGGAGQTSLSSQPDQAAEYAVLAAGWALALGIGLSSPARAGIAAGLAVGVGATELGFRLSDLGEVFRYGSSQGADGLWLMTAAWGVGVCGAVMATLAARRRGRAGVAASDVRPSPTPVAPVTVAPDPGLPTGAPSAVGFSWSAGEADRPRGHRLCCAPLLWRTDGMVDRHRRDGDPLGGIADGPHAGSGGGLVRPGGPYRALRSNRIRGRRRAGRPGRPLRPGRGCDFRAEPVRPAVTTEPRPYGPGVVPTRPARCR